MKKNNFFIAFFLLILTSCQPKEQTYTPPAIEVSIEVVDSVEQKITQCYIGKTEALQSLALGFELGGKITKINIKEGEEISSGVCIAEIDKSTAQQSYQSAKATYKQAQELYQRSIPLHERGSMSEVQWIELITQLEKARSLEQIAWQQLQKCELISPQKGVIGECNLKIGENYLPGTTAVTLINLAEMAITFSVSENEISRIKIGDTLQFAIPALGEDLHVGTIIQKGISNQTLSHTYKITVAPYTYSSQLLPGMTCKVYLTQNQKGKLLIPAKAIHTLPQGKAVWIVRNGTAHRQLVQTDKFVANGVLVTQGISIGDTLITDGYQKIYEGASIKIQQQ